MRGLCTHISACRFRDTFETSLLLRSDFIFCLIQTGEIVLDHVGERELALHLLKFTEVRTRISGTNCCLSDLCSHLCWLLL